MELPHYTTRSPAGHYTPLLVCLVLFFMLGGMFYWHLQVNYPPESEAIACPDKEPIAELLRRVRKVDRALGQYTGHVHRGDSLCIRLTNGTLYVPRAVYEAYRQDPRTFTVPDGLTVSGTFVMKAQRCPSP